MRHADSHPVPKKVTKEYGSVQRVRSYIEESYADNMSLEQLAQLVNLSPFHLLRTFRDIVGLPPHAYLTHIRVMQAKQLLRLGIPSVDVALLVGFADQSHFTKHFKRSVGVPPGVYMQSSKK
jgi:AraC-like DNA-binding protein